PYTFKIRNKCPGAPGSFTANGNFMTLPLRDEITTTTINIYPNPGSGFYHIEGIDPFAQVLIFDVQGQLVGTFQLHNNQLDLSTLANGMYRMYFPEHQISKSILQIK
ncbi:MAG: T9SS type A sorting domain-containing protein, partial [Chitinophagales bacterium]